MHIIGFLTEWQTYAQKVEGENWRGEKMDKGKIDKMSGRAPRFPEMSNFGQTRVNMNLVDQQLGQLYELMNAIREKELSENDPDYEPPSRG